MKIKEALEQEHSKAQTKRITDFVADDKNRFKELIDLFLGDEYRITQRAAWPLSNCGILHPELINPYQKALLKKLTDKGNHDAIKRNILRIWMHHMPPEELWGELFDTCYGFARSKDEPGAIRAFSIYVLGNITLKYPELVAEVRMLIEDLKPLGTPAIVSSGKKVLKQLEKV
jgi:hypothetical protein